MKRNKIAAGALALALVTPVVANAADGTYVTDVLPKAVEEKAVVDGQTFTKAQFQKALEEANKDYNAYLTAKKDYEALEKSYEVAVDRYNKAYDAFKKQSIVDENGKDTGYKSEVQSNFDIALDNLNNKAKEKLKEENFYYNEDKDTVSIVEDNTKTGDDLKEKKVEVADESKLADGEFDQAIDRAKKAYKELKLADTKTEDAQKLYREYTTASYEKDRLEEEVKAAKDKADKAEAKSDASIKALKGFAEAFNVIVTATNNGIAVVDKDQKPADKEISAEQLAKLQASIDKANETLKAVDLLKQFAPNTAKLNTAKLDALVAEQKATIAKAEAIIKGADKKVALIPTAFAAEESKEDSKEEVTSEDVDALIKELDDNTDAINKEMENLDKQVKDEDEEKPADKKDEDKKDEDKKDEEKPADKKDEDKKDEDKKEDKKVEKTTVVEKSANKAAGSNAKTGIAGVAGVAGVLAAASVAYAASKKNN